MYRREAQGRKDQRLSRRTCAQIAHKLEVERLRYLDSDRPVVSVGVADGIDQTIIPQGSRPRRLTDKTDL